MLAREQAGPRSACRGSRSTPLVRKAHALSARTHSLRSDRSVARSSLNDGGEPGPSGGPPPSGWWKQVSSLVGAAGVTAAAAAALTLGGMAAPPGSGPGLGPLAGPEAAQAVSTEQLLFLEAWRAVDRAYVDKTFNGQGWFRMRETYLKKEPMEDRQQTYAAIQKLLATLDDPFTRFLEPSRLARLRGDTEKSEVTGVGVEVSLTEEAGGASKSRLKVVAPTEGGPSDRAGVRPGDIISAVDGKSTQGISLYEASDLLQGAPGSSLVLTLQTPGKDGKLQAPRDVPLVREKVVFRPVSAATCSGVSASTGAGAGSGKVEYIRITTFNSSTVEGVVAAIKEGKAAGVDGLVLDMRNNGGGLFPAGVQVAKLLMPTGDIVLISDSSGVRDIYSADAKQNLDTTTPLSVWVNKGTGSASEVLAGALKDSGRGVVVGESTFGKGLIQTVVGLSDGSGLAVTVAKYQTPLGIDINKVGISPDIRISPDSLAVGGEAVCRQLAQADAPRVFG